MKICGICKPIYDDISVELQVAYLMAQELQRMGLLKVSKCVDSEYYKWVITDEKPILRCEL